MVKYCPMCNAKNSNNAKKCSSCGTPFIKNKIQKTNRHIRRFF